MVLNIPRQSYFTAVMTVFFTLITVSFVRAGNEQFTFLAKAKSHYDSEKGLRTDNLPVNSSIDSILKLKENDIDFQMAYSTSWEIGLFLLQQGKHPKALDIFNDLRSYLDAKTPVTDAVLKQRSSVYNIIGAIYEETGLWNEALDLYMNSLQICNSNNNNSGKAKVYNNIGKLYFNRNELKKAEELFLKAIEINKSLGIRQELFNNYNNMAGIYKSRNDFKQALEYALIALNQLDIKEDDFNLAILYPNIGALYQDMGNYTIALSYYEQASEIAEKRSYIITLIESSRSIASVYSDMNKNERQLNT